MEEEDFSTFIRDVQTKCAKLLKDLVARNEDEPSILLKDAQKHHKQPDFRSLIKLVIRKWSDWNSRYEDSKSYESKLDDVRKLFNIISHQPGENISWDKVESVLSNLFFFLKLIGNENSQYCIPNAMKAGKEFLQRMQNIHRKGYGPFDFNDGIEIKPLVISPFEYELEIRNSDKTLSEFEEFIYELCEIRDVKIKEGDDNNIFITSKNRNSIDQLYKEFEDEDIIRTKLNPYDNVYILYNTGDVFEFVKKVFSFKDKNAKVELIENHCIISTNKEYSKILIKSNEYICHPYTELCVSITHGDDIDQSKIENSLKKHGIDFIITYHGNKQTIIHLNSESDMKSIMSIEGKEFFNNTHSKNLDQPTLENDKVVVDNYTFYDIVLIEKQFHIVKKFFDEHKDYKFRKFTLLNLHYIAVPQNITQKLLDYNSSLNLVKYCHSFSEVINKFMFKYGDEIKRISKKYNVKFHKDIVDGIITQFRIEFNQKHDNIDQIHQDIIKDLKEFIENNIVSDKTNIIMKSKYKILLDAEIKKIEKEYDISFFISTSKDRNNEENLYIYIFYCCRKENHEIIKEIISKLNLRTYKFKVLNSISIPKKKLEKEFNVIIEFNQPMKGSKDKIVKIISFNENGPLIENNLLSSESEISINVKPYIYSFLKTTYYLNSEYDITFKENNNVMVKLPYDKSETFNSELAKLKVKKIFNNKSYGLLKIISNHRIFQQKIAEINDKYPTSYFLMRESKNELVKSNQKDDNKAKNSPYKNKKNTPKKDKNQLNGSSNSLKSSNRLPRVFLYLVSASLDGINEMLEFEKEYNSLFITEKIDCSSKIDYVKKAIGLNNRRSSKSVDELSNGSFDDREDDDDDDDDEDEDDVIINAKSFGVTRHLNLQNNTLYVNGYKEDIKLFEMALKESLDKLIKETKTLDVKYLVQKLIITCKDEDVKDISRKHDVKIIFPINNRKQNKDSSRKKDMKIKLTGTIKNINNVIIEIHNLLISYTTEEFTLKNPYILKLNLKNEFKVAFDFDYAFEVRNNSITVICLDRNMRRVKETIESLENEITSFKLPHTLKNKNLTEWLKSRNCKLESNELFGKQSDIEAFKEEFIQGTETSHEYVNEKRYIIINEVKKKFSELGKAHKASFLIEVDKIKVSAMKSKLDGAVEALKECIATLDTQLMETKIKIHDKIPVIAFNQENIKRIAKDCRTFVIFPETLASFYIEGVKVELQMSNIAHQHADALVNAANSKLSLGGGVSGALSKAAGPKLQEECDNIIRIRGELEIGEAVITRSYNLNNKTKYIIHTVGPTHSQNNRKELLKKSIFSVFDLASNKNLRSIAMPIISVGIFGYPIEEAVKVYSQAFSEYFSNNPQTSIQYIKIVSIVQSHISLLIDHFKEEYETTFNSFINIEDQNSYKNEFQWYWTENNGKLIPFDPDQNTQIERARQEGKKSLIVTGDLNYQKNGYEYEVNLEEYWELNTKFRANKRKIVCKPITESSTSKTRNVKDKAISKSSTNLTNKELNYEITVQGFEKNIKRFKKELNSLLNVIVQSDTIQSDKWSLEDEYIKKELDSICKRYYVDMEISKDEVKLLGVSDKLKQAKVEIQKILCDKNRLPPYWKPMSDGKHFELFSLNENSEEWRVIENEIKKTINSATILKVERVQNPLIWKKYMSIKKDLADELGYDKVNETYLFHGTRSNHPSVIYSDKIGFDMRHSEQGMWGRGNYFAVNASYSHNYAYTQNQERKFFWARVLVGDTIELPNNSAIRKPPLKPGSQFNYYDSIKGNTNGSDIYIIYENWRAYPEYLITYKC